MNKQEIRSWKKAFESDLSYIAYELKDVVQKPAVIILEGEVGVGKTTFSKYFIDDKDCSSPTYSIINEHKDILHADFYRIESKEDLIHLELSEYLDDKNFFIVEWGLKHLQGFVADIPESFTFYLLELNSPQISSENDNYRNFHLFKISEYL